MSERAQRNNDDPADDVRGQISREGYLNSEERRNPVPPTAAADDPTEQAPRDPELDTALPVPGVDRPTP